MTQDTDAPVDNRSVQINLAVNADLKWRDLIWFVDTARKSGVDPDEDVLMEFGSDYRELEGFLAFVDPAKLSD